MSEALDRYLHACETLTPQTLDAFMGHFAEDARFRDPFSDVRGKSKVRRVFEKMWQDVEGITFKVDDRGQGADGFYVRWTYRCTPKGLMGRRGPVEIAGMSHIRLDEAGMVTAHLDYWDPTPGIYERIPLIGSLIRSARKQIGAR